MSGNITKLKSGNVIFADGRICLDNLKVSQLISNHNKEELLSNVEIGVKDLVKKFLDKDYDLLSSCRGHSDEGCINNFKYVKVCCEAYDVLRLKKNITEINRKYGTTITCSVGKEDGPEEQVRNFYKNMCLKTYRKPVSFYIYLGDWDKCSNNYETMLKHFDEYAW